MNPLLARCLLCVLLFGAPGRAVAADRLSLGSGVTVGDGEVVEGDVVVVGADARVDGHVRGDVVVVGGRLTLGPHAQVDGDAVPLFGELERAASAVVLGSTVSVAGRVPGTARITARAPPTPMPRADRAAGSGALRAGRLLGWMASCLCLLVLGLLFLSTWPERSRNLRRTVEAAPLSSLLVGGLVTTGLSLLLLLMALTIVGLLGWPVLLPLLSIVWLAGITGVCEALGDRLPLPRAARGRAGSFVLGALAFSGIGLLLLAGGLASVLAAIGLLGTGALAVGAAVLSGLGRHPYGG